jgi:hypothetical protein
LGRGGAAGCGVGAAAFEATSGESDGFGIGAGSGGFGACIASSGETISTAIGSAVTDPNGCTSAKTSIAAMADKWTTADAAKPERINCLSSTILGQRLDAAPSAELLA